MAKYRKKPVVVEAEQWFPGKNVEGVIPLKDAPMEAIILARKSGFLTADGYLDDRLGYIETLEGGHIVCPGDWIITGIQGEKYACKPDVFEATYERVEPYYEVKKVNYYGECPSKYKR